MRSGKHFRLWLEEIAVTLLSAPTRLIDEDVRGPSGP